MRYGRALSEVYAMLVFGIMVVTSIALLAVAAGQYLSAEQRLALRSSYYPNLSITYSNGSLCIETRDSMIEKIALDWSHSVYTIPAEFVREEGKYCIPVRYDGKLAIIVTTRYGTYFYDPARDPRYAPCAPHSLVVEPRMLALLKDKCKAKISKTDTEKLITTIASGYLDPVFIKYFDAAKAIEYRGYVPFTYRDVSYAPFAPGMLLGPIYPGSRSRANLINVTGIAFASAEGRVFNVCNILYPLPAIRKVCPTRIIHGIHVINPDYNKAYEMGIPVKVLIIARFPGFWVLIGNGETSAEALGGHPNKYVEASLLLDNGSVIKLVWDKTYTTRHSSKTLFINKWNITVILGWWRRYGSFFDVPGIIVQNPRRDTLYMFPYRYPQAHDSGEINLQFLIKALPVSLHIVNVTAYQLSAGRIWITWKANATIFSETNDDSMFIISRNKTVPSNYRGLPSTPIIFVVNQTILKYIKR
jgi:hypothetical protein